ncbi:hypothetical protein [Streptomyces sp. NPDC086989]|uniref:hypothetical protein n=1 Tax=Streptomyces sp. NPDC086989 TaxID=3365764 RepID=UPI00380AF4C9
MEQSDISALLDVLVVEALSALKTERTERFLKELRRLNEGRHPDWVPLEEAKELAGSSAAARIASSARRRTW